ncbi:MAG: alcohol dehydrogenase [Deltaproteobacteria bacterium]|nr:alcohol dehydrogenase [Deltaproteobacteria bacterium]
MKALRVTRNGAPSEVLAVEEVERPSPGPGQLCIRVSAASLNFNDIDRCRGNVTSIPMPPPFTLGMDVCGTVDAAGDGAEDWIGRRVVAITAMAQGGIAEYALAPAEATFDAPDAFDDAEATAFVIPYHTTHLALFRRGRLEAGETLLVHAGASGLGSAAIQLGLARGARVIATAGGAAKVAACKEFGAEFVIDHTQGDFAEAVLDHTDDVGAHVVLDLSGGGFVEPSWRCVAREGRYLCVGFADDPKNGFSARPLRPTCAGNFSIVGVICAYMNDLPSAVRRAGLNPWDRVVAQEVHADLLSLIADGRIRPVVGRRIRMEEAGQALEAHEGRRTTGRSVVEVSS